MLFETIETEGLAHLSYVLGDADAGLCAVIDPRRDVGIYLDVARQNNVRITHIFETHIHADFVCGSRELAEQTGARIYAGSSPDYRFDHQSLRDGDALGLGALKIGVLHTPGHTPEHVCLLVSGGKGSELPWALFTGDILFAGAVGRPDLIGGGTEQKLARQLYHTLHAKVLPVGDEVEIYPAHGEGSPCGGNIGDRNTSTIGYERQNSPKLQVGNEDEFITKVLADLPPAPFYYSRIKQVNAQGAPVLKCLPAVQPLAPKDFQEEMKKADVVVVDAREIEAFGGAHIHGALNIALRKEFPIWAGWMLKPEQRILLVLGSGEDLEKAMRHLLRVGFDNLSGYLSQGMRGWMEAGLPFQTLPQMSVQQLKEIIVDKKRDHLQLLDVRRDDEWERGFIPGAKHVFAPYLPRQLGVLDCTKPVATYCGSGYRASIAASFLQQTGFRDVYNVPGSMKAWKAAAYPIEKPKP